MNADSIERVDAWLARRERWVNADVDRISLRHTWDLLVGAIKAWRSPGPRPSCHEIVGYSLAGAEAALTGILLAIVRKSWNDEHGRVEYDRRTASWYYVPGSSKLRDQYDPDDGCDTDGEALTDALVSSPPSKGTS